MVCCFLGHRETNRDIAGRVESVIEEQIALGAEQFLVGNQGAFDTLVLGILRKMKKRYPQIRYWVVLAYLPEKADEIYKAGETVFPEGLERIHPRYAIIHRNRYMVEQSDCVIAYVTHSWGGAAAALNYAERKGKKIIRII